MEKTKDELYEEFLDSRSFKRKIEVLRLLYPDLTDKIITDFAVSLDLVVDDGTLDDRYMSLMNALGQMARFETEGLR